jgi:amidase
MMLENIGPTHGSTTNPHNSELTPGGSSGGEGALLAMLASPLGIGTDIGGSIRSPAANCGIYGLKPSAFRLPLAGVHVFFSGCEMVPAAVGPMTPSRNGIAIFMKSILDTRPWEKDPSLLPIPWRELEYRSPRLNIGVMWDDGVVKPSAAMTRALREVVEKLEGNPRFRVFRWEPFKHEEGMKILVSRHIHLFI